MFLVKSRIPSLPLSENPEKQEPELVFHRLRAFPL